MLTTRLPLLIASSLLLAAPLARAETPGDFLLRYEGEARDATPGFAASATRGEAFFTRTHGNDWSCATCHTKNPSAAGKHATTGKAIEALAPAANPERFSRTKNVEKWFARNCKDVLGRTCTAAEKADVVAWLSGIQR